MKRIIFAGIIILATTLCSFDTHKFYVSVTQIEYVTEQQSLQIISRIFIDDLESLLQERYDTAIVLGEKEETPKVNTYLEKYINQKLKIKIDNKEVVFNFLGKEYEDDLIICYLEIVNIKTLKSIEVSNEVLMDLFEGQQNIIHIKKGKSRKSLILENGKSAGVLKF